jgi:hypothetical protein
MRLTASSSDSMSVFLKDSSVPLGLTFSPGTFRKSTARRHTAAVIPKEVKRNISTWQMAFRRGDTLQMAASAAAIWADVDPGSDVVDEIDEAMWAVPDADQLLTPAPLASLRQAIRAGWTYQLFGVAAGADENGHVSTQYQVELISPSGGHYSAEAEDRNRAFRAALDAAGIDF